MQIKKLPLTQKQKEVYEAAKALIEKNDYSPTVREIKESLNDIKVWKLKSTGSVQACLRGMRAKGWVSTMGKSRKARNLKLL